MVKMVMVLKMILGIITMVVTNKLNKTQPHKTLPFTQGGNNAGETVVVGLAVNLQSRQGLQLGSSKGCRELVGIDLL